MGSICCCCSKGESTGHAVQPQASITAPLSGPSQPNRKALLISIEYKDCGADGGPSELPFARRDAEYWKEVITRRCGYQGANVVLMSDSAANPLHRPTYENIQREMRTLVHGLQAGDRRFFFFAGHAMQFPTRDNGASQGTASGSLPRRRNTEFDGMDESIITISKNAAGEYRTIKDNHIKEWMVDPLVPGSILTAVVDTCHSGTILDLPYRARLKRRKVVFEDARPDVDDLPQCRGTVICVSACEDGQKATEWKRGSEQTGPLTLAMSDLFDPEGFQWAPQGTSGSAQPAGPIRVKALLKHLKKHDKPNQQTPWVTCGSRDPNIEFAP
ncbi:hypothetical protein FRB99_003543 [Tulasnella sp. 403]|nr:hypothetical protein FRB99_003543 [Tulasnella sp. 403]